MKLRPLREKLSRSPAGAHAPAFRTFEKIAQNAGKAARILLYMGAAIVSVVGLYGIALISAESLLIRRDVPADADIIVVLGGDGPPRAARAAALWHEGRARRVLVTGRGDCNFIRRILIEMRVPSAAIVTECRSASTWENAAFSQPILAGMQIRRAILVTSWFHSGRAVKRFRSVMPEIQWMSVPAEREESYWRLAFDPDGIQIFKEYPKIMAYDIRSRISEMALLNLLRPISIGAGQ
ncbi:YdcF family protein [Neorhizobium sp. DT-125]